MGSGAFGNIREPPAGLPMPNGPGHCNSKSGNILTGVDCGPRFGSFRFRPRSTGPGTPALNGENSHGFSGNRCAGPAPDRPNLMPATPDDLFAFLETSKDNEPPPAAAGNGK